MNTRTQKTEAHAIETHPDVLLSPHLLVLALAPGSSPETIATGALTSLADELGVVCQAMEADGGLEPAHLSDLLYRIAERARGTARIVETIAAAGK